MPAAEAPQQPPQQPPPPPPPRRCPVPCAGVRADLAARAPHYASDWREGLCAPRALSAAAFALFAQAIPAAAFAMLLHAGTGGALGVTEALLAMGACGLLFAVCAGQPLVLVGATGPVCLLVVQLHQLSAALGVDPRGALFYACVWAAGACGALAACSAPRALAARLTAFSADAFGALVGLIYVVEGAAALAALAAEPGSGGASLALGLGAAAAAAALARARSLAPRGAAPAAAAAAAALADYALPLAVVALSAAAAGAPAGLLAQARAAGLPLLPVPPALAPSDPAGRPWLDAAAIARVPPWAAAAAAAPGAVIAALLFFDHTVSALLSQAASPPLRKPAAYDWDFALLGAALLLCGALGLPPVYGLLPQAPLHVAALREGGAGGRVLETRWSAALQAGALLALLSPPLLAALGAVPQGVMAGVMLYLGGEGLAGNGAVLRAAAVAGAAAARAGGCGRSGGSGGGSGALPAGAGALVSIQVACVLAVFGVTRSAAGALFPLLIMALVPLRLVVLPWALGEGVMEALDPRDWGRGAAAAAAAAEEEEAAAAAAAAAAEEEAAEGAGKSSAARAGEAAGASEDSK
jgi:hypothetical protein